MQDCTLELCVSGASTRDSNIALRKALEALAGQDPEFHRRVLKNGIAYIIDASPGCVRLPADDAARVSGQLRAMGHEVTSRDLPLVPIESSSARSAARRDYIGRRG